MLKVTNEIQKQTILINNPVTLILGNYQETDQKG